MENEKLLLPEVKNELLSSCGVTLHVLRLDLLHQPAGGNKFFKLKYNIEEMKKRGLKKLLTFGGAFSNHILATSAAGKENRIETLGIIRGEELNEHSNVVLQSACANGMRLYFVTREEYRTRYREEYHRQLKERFGNFHLLPEGGSNSLAVKGCSEIIALINKDFDFICVPVGTGATLAGIACALSKKQQALGFVALANAKFLDEEVDRFIKEYSGKDAVNAKLIHDFHFGRYARSTDELEKFMQRFKEENNIPLEATYSGKMMYGIFEMLKGGYFVSGEKIIAVHTGGLQVKRSSRNDLH